MAYVLVGKWGGEYLAKCYQVGGQPLGYYILQTGFRGEKGNYFSPLVKVRTMEHGAQDCIDPFYETAIVAGSPKALQPDNRIVAPGLRKWRVDELPQAKQTMMGKPLVGARGWTEGEQYALGEIARLRSSLNLSDIGMWVLGNYRAIVDMVKPESALLGANEALASKDTPPLVRAVGDVCYWLFASPLADVRLVKSAFDKTVKKVGAR